MALYHPDVVMTTTSVIVHLSFIESMSLEIGNEAKVANILKDDTEFNIRTVSGAEYTISGAATVVRFNCGCTHDAVPQLVYNKWIRCHKGSVS